MKWLTGRGAAAALAVGLATVWGFGWRGVVLLLAFFVSSSLLSEKTTRNERQVIANGGVAAVAALAGSWMAFAGALAAASADTWASEIGRRSRTPPRLITTGSLQNDGDGALGLRKRAKCIECTLLRHVGYGSLGLREELLPE